MSEDRATARIGESAWLRMLQLSSIPSIELGRLASEVWGVASKRVGVAPVRPSPVSYSNIGEAMLDHTFTLAMNAMTGIPDRTQMERQRAEMRAAWGVFDERGWLDDPRGFHREPPPLRDWTLRDERTLLPSRTHFKRLSFASEYEPWQGIPGGERWQDRHHNRTSHAQVLEHKGRPRPWLVCIHGFGMGTPSVNFTGFAARWLHEELGLNVIFPTLPLHGLRTTSRVSGGDLLAPDYIALIHSFAQAVWDIRRTIGWIRARGGEQIGLYGLSLGGCNAAMVASIEDNLECVIAGIPVVDFPRVARDNAPWVVDWFHDRSNDWNLLSSTMRVVSPLGLQPRLPIERRFIFAGHADRVVPPHQARALWMHWNQPAIHWYPGGHVFGFMGRDVRDFVKDSLSQSGMLQADN